MELFQAFIYSIIDRAGLGQTRWSVQQADCRDRCQVRRRLLLLAKDQAARTRLHCFLGTAALFHPKDLHQGCLQPN